MARFNTITTITVVAALMSCAVDGTEDTEGVDGDEAADGEGLDEGVSESELTTPVYPASHPRIYVGKHKTRLNQALSANTPAATRFRTRVDQWVAGEDIWGFEAWNGALLGVLTNDAKYCNKAVAVVEAQVAAAESKIASGAQPEVANDSYLHIGEMVGDLALVYDWCYAKVSGAQRTRWIDYANQAIWNVWHHTQAQWGGRAMPWSGWSVDNPSNNYYYSFLRATMLVGLATRGENSQAAGWITQFRTTKIANQLVPTFNKDLVGGASREGTGYGVAMRKLFELYDWWYATTGEQIALLSGHTKSSMLAFMHQTLPTLDRVAPTGDLSRDSTAAFFDYHRNYLQELASMYPTTTFAGRAKTMLSQSSVPSMGSSFMLAYDFLYDNTAIAAKPLGGNLAYHAKGIGQLYARSGWDKAATWVNLTAGPYTESHAHQDQGALMIYKGGWLAYDSVIHSKSGLNQDTGSHGVVRIDSGGTPVRQVATTVSKMLALKQTANFVYASADVTPAYAGNAAVQKVQREMVYLKPNVVVVYDRVTTASGTTQTWQLPTPVRPTVSGNTATIANAGHNLKVTRIAPSSAAMSTYSFASNADFTGGFRLDERVSGGDVRYLHVLSVDGGATSTTASGANGVTVNLAGGGRATVTFNPSSVGGSLNLNGVTTALTAGVATLAP